MQNINDISEFQTFKTNHAYQLRLMDDEEILSKAESAYSAQLLKSREHTLDSPLFGATISNPICSVCFQRVEDCPGHYSVIQLPFPIVRSICLTAFKSLITLICPVCSRFIISNAKNALSLAPEHRLPWIRKETEKINKGDTMIQCPHCFLPQSYSRDGIPIKKQTADPFPKGCCRLPCNVLFL